MEFRAKGRTFTTDDVTDALSTSCNTRVTLTLHQHYEVAFTAIGAVDYDVTVVGSNSFLCTVNVHFHHIVAFMLILGSHFGSGQYLFPNLMLVSYY